MNNFQIIPAIDIIDGKCVRLTKGNYKNKSVYPLDPLEQVRKFERDGYRQLHIIDLDAAKLGKSSNGIIIKEILSSTDLKVQVGGGFRTPKKISEFINSGADQIIVSSILFDKDFDWASIDPDMVTASIDFDNGKIVTNGWIKSESGNMNKIVAILKGLGVSRTIVTDISRDGTLSGPNIELAQKFKRQFGKEVLIAGGVRNVSDIEDIKKAGLDGVVVGKVLYETGLNIE